MKIEIGMGQTSVISKQSAAAADPGSGGVRSEILGSSELPVSRGGFVSQSAGDESVGAQDCPEMLRRWVVLGPDWRGRESAAVDAGGAPPGLRDSWGRWTWACARQTRSSPGFHMAGLQPGGKVPSVIAPSPPAMGMVIWGGSVSRCKLVLHDAGDEWLMARDCPEIGGVGGDRGGGVKAVEGYRSPRPGGLMVGLEKNGHPYGLCRGGARRTVGRSTLAPL